MKKILVLTLICFFTMNLIAQTASMSESEKRSCVTLGILQGGGSLVGADLEVLLTDRLGIQLGAGFVGFGGGINYHIKPSIRSSFFSFQYWNQGVGDLFTQNIASANFVYRGKKWFTCQLGLGAPLSRGPAMPSDFVQPPVMFTYAIGAYIPF